MFGGLFNSPKSGNMSTRRFLAFIYSLAGIAAGGYCIYTQVQDWKVIAAAFGIPAVVSLILLLFTTWDELNNTIDAVKGNSRRHSVDEENYKKCPREEEECGER